MGNVVDIQDYIPHYFFEGMCLKCLDRWVIVVPVSVVLKMIECKQCGPGYVIDTGQQTDPRTETDPEGEAS